MTTLAEFLDARITETEDQAKGARRAGEQRFGASYPAIVSFDNFADPQMDDGWLTISVERVLAECAAKRRIIADRYADRRILAAIWADHPDYDKTWRI